MQSQITLDTLLKITLNGYILLDIKLLTPYSFCLGPTSIIINKDHLSTWVTHELLENSWNIFFLDLQSVD